MRTIQATKTPTKVPTAVGSECPPKTPTLPRGLSYEDRPDKPLPFLARWREAGGRKKSRAFADAAARDSFAATWSKRREAWGKAVPVIHPREADVWRTFAELTGGADPLMVARFWLAHRTIRGGEMTIATAADKLLALHDATDATGDTPSHLRLHLRRLRDAMGPKRLADVQPDDLRAWLASLRDPETGAEMEPYTQRHHLRTARLLFSTAVREKWTSENPAEAVKAPKIEAAEICVLKIEDAEQLFKVNRDALCIGRLALEAFGGLRYSSAARISRAEILDAERGIEMPGAKHKSGLRHYVDGYPDNLWQWIAHAHPAGWDVEPRKYLDLKAKMFADAKVENPGNVLRHSFCSYHVSLHKDAARTAVLLTHRSPAMLYQHYRGRATAADAARYFAISP